MKRTRVEQQDEGAGEPTDLGERASGAPAGVRSSGVFARSERPPPDRGRRPSAALWPEVPCSSFADVLTHYRRHVWDRILAERLEENDAKDVFQDVFTAAHRWFRENPMPRSVTALLLTIVHHKLVDHARDRERRESRLDAEVEPDTMPSSKPDPEQLAERAEWWEEVEAILARLPDHQAAAFRLIEIEGVSHGEAAARVGASVETLTVRLHRARARFWALVESLHHPDRRGSR